MDRGQGIPKATRLISHDAPKKSGQQVSGNLVNVVVNAAMGRMGFTVNSTQSGLRLWNVRLKNIAERGE